MGTNLLSQSKQFLDEISNNQELPSKETVFEQMTKQNSPFSNNSVLIFGIYHTTELLNDMYETILSEYGISLSQAEILKVLYLSPKNQLFQSDIIKYVLLSKATLSTHLKKLEQQGLIKRKENPNNKRQKSVLLTKKGVKKFEEISEPLSDISERNFISEEKSQKLVELLKEFKNNIPKK